MKIGNRTIDEEHPPFIIAEAGINHGGDLQRAFRLALEAKEAGADCIKFQSHIAHAETNHPKYNVIKKCELSEENETRLCNFCKQYEILFLSTPFSIEAADRLEEMGVPAFKIGSGQCNDLSFVEYIAKKGKPIILSTGMSNISEIWKSVNVIEKYSIPFILMHCVSKYPTPYDEVNLKRITRLQNTFWVPVGLSDHSVGIYTCLGAVALGAVVLEKHFTVSHYWEGPDISSSIEPQELKELVNGSKAIWKAMR